MIFWASTLLTMGLLATVLPIGGPELFGFAVAVLLLPHLFIGDVFHWSRFPELTPPEKTLWLSLTVGGIAVFVLMRQAGAYMLPLFYLYFFGHFWKDLDLAIGQVGADPTAPRLRRPKRWCGALLLVAYAVVSSGLVEDPRVVGTATVMARAVAGILGIVGLGALARARRSSDAADVLWGRYSLLSACFLLLCAWFHALHPAHSLLPHAVIAWHFMFWYVFTSRPLLQRAPAAHRLEARPGLERLKHSTVGFLTLVLAANLVSAAGAWMYGVGSGWEWLRYVYNYQYLAGYWTVMHVTWDWVPKRIQGIRLAVV